MNTTANSIVTVRIDPDRESPIMLIDRMTRYFLDMGIIDEHHINDAFATKGDTACREFYDISRSYQGEIPPEFPNQQVFSYSSTIDKDSDDSQSRYCSIVTALPRRLRHPLI